LLYPETIAAKWLFPQEKATLHGARKDRLIVEPLYEGISLEIVCTKIAYTGGTGQDDYEMREASSCGGPFAEKPAQGREAMSRSRLRKRKQGHAIQ
jgi:hypothetical protein